MANKTILVTFLMFACAFNLSTSKPADMDIPVIISRDEWGAERPTSITHLSTPVPFAIIHHSSSPPACFNQEACSQAMRDMQHYHQQVNRWADIGYNFAVGSDGLVYEGRGWNRVGAHAAPYNTNSIGIVLIGHWVSELPPPAQLQAAQNLISLGVRLGYIQRDYSLVGHRQVRATECPGQTLFNHISRWQHFDPSMQYEPENEAY